MLINKNFIKFLLIGGSNTVICMILFWGLNKIGFNYLLSSALMNIFGIIEGYILNAKLLYKTNLKLKELFKYFNVYAVAFVLNLIMMYVFVSCMHIQKLLAQILTTGILTIINYQIVKLFVFKSK